MIEINIQMDEYNTASSTDVKSGKFRSRSSLDKCRRHFSSVIGNSCILDTKDVMIKDGIIHLPIYMAELH